MERDTKLNKCSIYHKLSNNNKIIPEMTSGHEYIRNFR